MTIFCDRPAREFGRAAGFWAEVTGSTLSEPRGATGEFATLLPSSGNAYLRVQRVARDQDPGQGCHLDLHLDPADQSLDDAADQAVRLGAGLVHREPGLVVLSSPGGFRFCLAGWNGEADVPSPVPSQSAGSSRLDQLCLDSPPETFEAECSFWAALTGWELNAGSVPQFAFLTRPEPMPVRLLLQRRDAAEPGELVRAHPDFATTDAARLAGQHTAAGALVLARFPNWITLADPAGSAYCLTRRDPLTGRLPAAVAQPSG